MTNEKSYINELEKQRSKYSNLELKYFSGELDALDEVFGCSFKDLSSWKARVSLIGPFPEIQRVEVIK